MAQQTRTTTEQLRILSQSAMLEEARTPYLVRASILVICFSFIAFVAWSALTRINELARTTGEISPSSHIQIIQHLEGGIVEEIAVRDDDRVKAGQVLLRMSGESTLSDLQRLREKAGGLERRIGRLRNFIAGDETVIPETGTEQAAGRGGAVDDNLEILEGMIRAHRQEQEVIRQQLVQKQKQVGILNEQLATSRKALQLAETAFATQEALYKERLVPETTYIAALRDINSQRGEIQALQIEIQQAQDAISEFEWRLRSTDSTAKDAARQQLVDVESEHADTREMLAKVEKQVERLAVRSPVDGIVKGLEVHTRGGVVAPGSKLMEIVPVEGELLAEIRIAPSDIGHIKVGFPAKVKVTSFDFSRYGTIDGTVTGLSATTFSEPQGQTYYKGIVTLAKNHVGENPGENIILPGMIVNADIITGKKSLLAYLLKPIHRALNSSFGER